MSMLFSEVMFMGHSKKRTVANFVHQLSYSAELLRKIVE